MVRLVDIVAGETDMQDKIVIGFSNVSEQNPFTRKVRENLEIVAARTPGVELIVRDNALDTPRAIANAKEFAEANVDVAIIFHIDERAGQEVVNPLRLKQIPIMAIDIPIGRTVYFGLDNEAVGVAAGEVLADWILTHWKGQVDKTLVVAEHRLLEFFQQRFTCAVDVLEKRVPTFSRDHTLYLDNGGAPDVTAQRVGEVLDRWGEHRHIAVVCMNDDVAVGTLRAIHERNRAGDVALLSHDGTHVALEEFQRPAADRAMVVSTLLRAEIYGQRLIELAVKMARKEHVEPWNYVETVPITAENFREHVAV